MLNYHLQSVKSLSSRPNMMISVTSTKHGRLTLFSKQRKQQVTRATICPTYPPNSYSFPALSFDTQRKRVTGGGVLGLKRDQVIMATQAIKPSNESRPLANFHPNIWGDRFLLSDFENDQLIKGEKESSLKVGALTQDLKTRLREIGQYPFEQLKLINTIQRLGIDYHFEKEIDRALQDIHDDYLDFLKSNNDLYSNALGFRLLRQHGYTVSSEVFEKFKDVKGEFKASITGDIIGMLEFYEATYFSIEGEDVLDHGRAFTSAHLHSVLPNLSSAIGTQVTHALDTSNRRGLPRLETRNYISIYKQYASRHENLLKLAKLDFNLLQSLHQRELSELYSWWKGLDVPRNFFYARDRCVEVYLCTLGVYFEPQYVVARKYTTRMGLLLTILDDTYDAYGTFEELQTLTSTIESWNIPCLNSLPSSMEVLYKALWQVVKDIEDEVVDGEIRASYAKEVIKRASRAYFEEVKWREEKYKPKTTEEYMSVATKSIIGISAVVISYIGMGDIVTKDVFNWWLSSPVEFKAAGIFGRLRDDLAGHEFEKEREHIPSMVECYMNEHGVSQQEAIQVLNNHMENAWKDLNGKFLMLAKFPAPLLHRPLNFLRVVEFLYKRGDFFTHVGQEMQNVIKQILIDPVPE